MELKLSAEDPTPSRQGKWKQGWRSRNAERGTKEKSHQRNGGKVEENGVNEARRKPSVKAERHALGCAENGPLDFATWRHLLGHVSSPGSSPFFMPFIPLTTSNNCPLLSPTSCPPAVPSPGVPKVWCLDHWYQHHPWICYQWKHVAPWISTPGDGPQESVC